VTSTDPPLELHVNNWYFCAGGNRAQVLESGGCPLLVDIVRHCSSLAAEEVGERLKYVTCGCLLNVANQNGESVDLG